MSELVTVHRAVGGHLKAKTPAWHRDTSVHRDHTCPHLRRFLANNWPPGSRRSYVTHRYPLGSIPPRLRCKGCWSKEDIPPVNGIAEIRAYERAWDKERIK